MENEEILRKARLSLILFMCGAMGVGGGVPPAQGYPGQPEFV